MNDPKSLRVLGGVTLYVARFADLPCPTPSYFLLLSSSSYAPLCRMTADLKSPAVSSAIENDNRSQRSTWPAISERTRLQGISRHESWLVLNFSNCKLAKAGWRQARQVRNRPNRSTADSRIQHASRDLAGGHLSCSTSHRGI